MFVCPYYNVLCFFCCRYSQLNPLCISLAYSGVLVRRNSQRQQSSKSELVSERGSSQISHKDGSKKEGEENDTLKKLQEKLSPGLLHDLSQLFFQHAKVVSLSQRRVLRRERPPLKLWMSRLKCTDAQLPCCWTRSTNLPYISEGPW